MPWWQQKETTMLWKSACSGYHFKMLIAQHSIPDVFKVQDVLLKGRRKGGGEQVMRGGREQGQGYLADPTWCIMATRHTWVFFNATHFSSFS
jgi:hypothetical protein